MKRISTIAATVAGASALSLLLAAAPSHAVTVNDYTDLGKFAGNDCTGGGQNSTWGDNVNNPFDSTSGSIGSGACTLEGSAAILRINFDNNGNFTLPGDAEFSSLFPTIDGTEFRFSFGQDGNPATGGTWTYTPDDAEDPGITGFVTKGGPNYRVFLKDGPAFKGIGDFSDFITPGDGGQQGGLSHITFFDSTTPVPLPAAGWLMIAGIGGIAALRRRRKAA
jgi:hypothetical protein